MSTVEVERLEVLAERDQLVARVPLIEPLLVLNRGAAAPERHEQDDRADQGRQGDRRGDDQEADPPAVADVIAHVRRSRAGRGRDGRRVQVRVGARVDLGDAVHRREQLGVAALRVVGLDRGPHRRRGWLHDRVRGHDVEVRRP
jgi:hypothetical protein